MWGDIMADYISRYQTGESIDNALDDGVAAKQEVVAARGNYNSVSARLSTELSSKVDASVYTSGISNIQSQIDNMSANGWLMPVDTNTQSEAGKTDMSSSILSMLNSNGYCHLSEGIFYVSGFEMPEGATLEGCGKKTIVRLLSSVSDGYCVRVNRYNTVNGICFSGGYNYPQDIFTSGASLGTRHGIYLASNADGTEQAHAGSITNAVTDCWFENFNGSAYYAHNTGGSTDGAMIMSDCKIRFCKVGINIDYYSEYSKFSNIIITQTNTACINNGGNNLFTACTFHGVVGFVMDNSSGTKQNGAHGSCVGCTFNHINNMNNVEEHGMGDAIVVKNMTNGFIFTGCQLWFGEINIQNSRGITFTSCQIGGGTPTITITGSTYPSFFIDCVFHAVPSIIAPDGTRFIHCLYDYDGSAIGSSYISDDFLIEEQSGSTEEAAQWYELSDITIPVGRYVVSFDSITSDDTDSNTCRGMFYDEDYGYASNYFQIPRGNNVNVTVSINSTAKHFRINQSDTLANSAGDTMSFTGLRICTESAWDESN